MLQASLITQSPNVQSISFHGKDLFLVGHGGEPYTPMKPIVEGMGLDWKSQHKKMSDNHDRWGMVIITIPVAGQRQRAVCMPLRKLPAFFASISVNKVREELRATIILFQNECDDALWKYWTGQQVQRECKPTPALESTVTPSTAEDRKPLRSLVYAWSQAAGIHISTCWPQVKAHFQLSRIDDLPVEWIPDALAFVQGKIDGLPKALPEWPLERIREISRARLSAVSYLFTR